MLNKIIRRILNLRYVLKSERGFSLIEIMVAITIIAIIGAVVVPRLMNIPKKAKVTAAKTQLKNFGTALLMYYQDKSQYPTTDEGLQALVTNKQLKELPKDPWGREYIYRSPGESDDCSSYEIITYGEDGKPGGEKYSKDLKACE